VIADAVDGVLAADAAVGSVVIVFVGPSLVGGCAINAWTGMGRRRPIPGRVYG
jgi:hypothetical protein